MVEKILGKVINRIWILCMAIFMCVCMLPESVFASEESKINIPDVDTTRTDCSITVTHLDPDENVVEGVISHLYKIADVDEDYNFTFKSEFGTNETFDIYDLVTSQFQEKWVETLSTVIAENSIEATQSGVSDSNGQTVYSELETGAYMLISESITKDEWLYSFEDFITAIPLFIDGEFVYNITASPKKSKTEFEDPEYYYVVKRWSDSGYEGNRAAYVTIHIFCDGVEVETVKLSADNNWSYKWKSEKGHKWTVTEDPVEGYSSSVSRDGNTFVITNTYIPPDEPDEPDEPEEPDVPSEPGEPDYPNLEETPGGEVLGMIRKIGEVLGAKRLPQTGLLWWPIPFLVIAGLLFIGLGIRSLKKKAE